MTRTVRFSLLGVALVVLVAAGLGFAWWQGKPGGSPTAPPVNIAATPVLPPSRSADAPQINLPPSFDAVHIAPDGQAVIAGRAAPGAEVTVLDGDRVVGKVKADPNGEWVLTPDQPLPPGAHQLTLAARSPGGGEPAHSAATVAVIVPERPAAPAEGGNGVVAVLLPHTDAGAASAIQLPGRAGRHLVLDIVEYQASGAVLLSGRSDPAAKIDIFVNDHQLDTAQADGRGSWSGTLTAGVPLGRYRLVIEAFDSAGTKLDQLSYAMRRAAAGELAPGDYIAVVPGNNLWHVAERSYGEGGRFVEIYRANPQRIADPNLIYPGQFLALPAKQQNP